MMLKEKCIYYNPSNDGYYLVLSITDELIYGRCGDKIFQSDLEAWIHQDGPGLRFKIDDFIINRDYIRNYFLDEKELEDFILKKELTDEEFYPIELLIHSRYKFPDVVIDVHKHMNDASDIVSALKHKKSKLEKIKKDISTLEKALFNAIRK